MKIFTFGKVSSLPKLFLTSLLAIFFTLGNLSQLNASTIGENGLIYQDADGVYHSQHLPVILLSDNADYASSDLISVEKSDRSNLVQLNSSYAPSMMFANGDFSLDFIAAAPFTYDHAVGGGAYDDRTIGKADDTVESLEGGDFSCGDIVTYFVAVTVDDTQSAQDDGPQTIELDLSFLGDTTGQPGVGIVDIVYVGINYGTVVDLIEGNHADTGNMDDGGSTATLINECTGTNCPGVPPGDGTVYTAGSYTTGTIIVTDLERAEQVIVRVDVLLGCDIASILAGTWGPTGNLQGDLADARLTYINGNVPVDPAEAVPGGAQTVPFKKIGDLNLVDLSLVKTVADGPYYVGDNVTWTVSVSNDGEDPATNVVVKDVLPCGLSFVSMSGGDTHNDATLEWTINTINPGETVDLTLITTVLDGAACGDGETPYVNIASIASQTELDIDSTPGNPADSNGTGGIGSEDPDSTQDPNDEDDGDDQGIIVCNLSMSGGEICLYDDGTLSTKSTIDLDGSGTPAASNPYVSSDTGIATVDDNGLVTAVSDGTVTITYTDDNGCQVTPM
ncbi:Ig-like domain-containing protein [Aegicerativicinus sediminis]|uniref:Ig-like domain-containing protein n=1 Tax=Aegicerativicinus sediminis TaxID=2893202 RepID=UPI001E4BDD60|nr:Ig-like domain-containing protein [Aegicerativicinus sediminis]